MGDRVYKGALRTSSGPLTGAGSLVEACPVAEPTSHGRHSRARARRLLAFCLFMPSDECRRLPAMPERRGR